MSLVQGLMGPYMKLTPIGASFLMLFSLMVAFMIAPIASIKLIKPHHLIKSALKDGIINSLKALAVIFGSSAI